MPEFLYQQMYDPKHRFQALSAIVSDRPKLYQKGLREYLLCGDCEQLLSKFESYASQIFYGKGAPTSKRDKNMIVLGGLDYTKMKLFLLSILWRFGVTTLTVFKGAELGPHAEKLRKMLLSQNPGSPLDYPCFLTAVTWQGNHIGDFIVPPCLARMEAHHIWSFVVAGIVFTFYVSSHKQASMPEEAFLQTKGSMLISIKEITDIEFLYRFASEVSAAQKNRK